MQKSIFLHKIQKSLCITTKSLYTNSNVKHNYLENYNDSEDAVKTKNAPFFMIFPNISFVHMIITYWTGLLSHRTTVAYGLLPLYYTHMGPAQNLLYCGGLRSHSRSHRREVSPLV